MINYFTWSEFDKSVEHIAKKCNFLKFSGIYGVPRGGLCLAVALSHKLKIKLISKPTKYSLIVDQELLEKIQLLMLTNLSTIKIKTHWMLRGM